MLQLKNISKTYRSKNGVTHRALNNISLSFDQTGLVFIVGRSGGGKSTLLNMIAALDKPDSGDMLLFGNSFKGFRRSDYDYYRNTYVGVIFQEYNLLPTLNIYQNVALSLGLQNCRDDERVNAALQRLGLTDMAHRKPNEISGGQSQRVAIARAIVKDPKIILADEPTGNLDSKTGKEMFDIFKELSKEKLVIIVTHDRDIADEMGDRVIEIKDGRVHKDLVRTTKLYEPAVDTVGDRLIRVPTGKKLDDTAIDEINEIIKRTDKDTFVINEHDTQKVKSMNLHVKNAVELVQSEASTYYFPYRPQPQEQKPLSPIKSKMPAQTGLRMSLSMLKYKKFRLVLTVVMLVIALFLSAVVGSFKFYDTSRAIAKTVVKEGYGYIPVSKNGTYKAEKLMKPEDTALLELASDRLFNVYFPGVRPVFSDTTAKYRDARDYHIFKKFNGIVEADDDVFLGAAYIAGGAPTKLDEVAISEVVAHYMAENEVYRGADSYDALIGKQITLADTALSICGVYEADTSNYDRLVRSGDQYYYSDDDPEVIAYNSQMKLRDGYAVVAPGFTEAYVKETRRINVSLRPVSSGVSINASYLSRKSFSGEAVYGDKSADGVYIDEYLYEQMFTYSDFSSALSTFNSGDNDYIADNAVEATGTQTGLVFNDLKIAAVVKGDEGIVYIDDQDMDEFVNDILVPQTVMVKTYRGVSQNRRLIDSLVKNGFNIDAGFFSAYNNYKQELTILSDALTRTLVMVSIIAALLLFSFISASVKLESRNIGIIRGMGARGIDAFKAFGIEGIIITSVSLLLSLILIVIFFPLINASISARYDYAFYSLIVNVLTVLIMILTSALITAAAIAIPLMRLTKQSPVDAINKNQTQR